MRSFLFVLASLLVLLAVTLATGVALGTTHLPLTDVYETLWHGVVGGKADVDVTTRMIVWRLRLPRVLLGAVVGGGLAIIGVAMQALVRNPLAEPYILGISSGAAAGVSLFYLGFLPPLLARYLSLPLAAFVGGLASISVVYLVARQGPRLSVTRLLLAGVAMAALMGAVSSFVTFASPNAEKLRSVLFLLLGSLSGARWETLTAPALASVGGLILLLALARPLDALLLGEEPAHSLGMPVGSLKRLLIVLSALVTGTLVAYSGTIGFVGLIIPHAMRSLLGVPHRRLVPVCFLAGGIFVIWADLLARMMLPGQELPVGIITALCGVPFFLWLLHRRPYAFGG